jgi:ATP-dependent Clp protease ATP-binding subunit ClpA
MYCDNLKPEKTKFFSLGDTRIEKEKKESALPRFGRELTEMGALGALPPLIGRRAGMLKITQIPLQSRKNHLILVGEPGVEKPGLSRV